MAMTGKETFKIWAPAESKWAAWARPVPFAEIGGRQKADPAMELAVPRIDYIDGALGGFAIILDLPGHGAIREAVALAMLGFRPVPLYNGTSGQKGAMALVDSDGMEDALIWGAKKLERLEIPEDAPPAFLLDSNRTHRFLMDASVFDNSWDIYEQDMPSAGYFLGNGIDRIIVKGQSLQKDLAKILYKFQKKGMAILFTNGYEKPKMAAIKKPRDKS